MIMNRCLDCNKIISNRAKRCYSCNNKHRWQDEEYRANISKKVTQKLKGRKLPKEHRNKVVKTLKIFKTSKDNSGYIDGRTLKKYYCKDCGKEIHYKTFFYGKGRCKSCCQKGKLSSNYGKIGKDAYNYIDGRTSLAKLIRDRFQNKKWIKNCLERDNYTCQECGQIGGRLHIHHKKTFAKILKEFLSFYNYLDPIEDKYELLELSKSWKEFWDINNGVTLCKECHENTESYFNGGYNEK